MNSIISFGKYKGKTLKFIYKADEKYFYWLVLSGKVKPTICLDDEMPFGKYKGELFGDVISIDGEYYDYLLSKCTDYNFCEIAKGWADIYSDKDAAPEEAAYVLACRGDMHLYFSIQSLRKGESFWKYDDECIAYYKVPEYSADNSDKWCSKDDYKAASYHYNKLVIGIQLNSDKSMNNMILYNGDPLWGLAVGETPVDDAYHSFFMYTQTMHGIHWDIWETKNIEKHLNTIGQ